MPAKHDDSGKRWVEMEFLVPGTPEQVWHAVATGPGMGAWFTAAVVDENVGGTITFDFGDESCGGGGTSSGRVTGWEPPVRFAYEEHDWSGSGNDPSPLATEITITSRSGDQCVVRMVHSLFTEKDDWDDELESFEGGWPVYFEVLRTYLRNFAGRPAAAVRAMAANGDGGPQAWSKLADALNLDGANAGERRETPAGAPRLAGVVERVHQDTNYREVMLRLDEPRDGIAVIGNYQMGGEVRANVSIFFYSDDAAETARAEQKTWTSWLAEHAAT